MPSVFAKVPKTKLKFYLFPEDISPPIEKKLAALGWPELDLRFSTDKKLKLEDLGEGKFTYIDGDFSDNISLIEPTASGSFSAMYDPNDCSITYEFEGDFLIFGYTDEHSAAIYTGIKTGYAFGVQVADAKGKSIKLPNNDYGMSLPLQGTVVKAENGDVYVAMDIAVTSRD